MKFRHLLAIILLLFLTAYANAQKIKLKKGILLVDGNKVLRYEKINRQDIYHYYQLNTTDEVFYIKLERNGTINFPGDDYKRIYFSEYDIELKSNSLPFGINNKALLKIMIQEGVLNLDGTINKKKIEPFFEKYNDNVSKY